MPDFGNFPHCAESKLALGVLGLWQSDAALAEYFEGGIKSYEIRELLEADSLIDRTLAIFIDSTREELAGANRRAKLETAIAAGVVRLVGDRDDTGDFMSHRVVNHMKALIDSTRGQVVYESECVSIGLIRYEQPPPVLIAGGTMVLSVLRCVFEQQIRQETREVIV